MTVKELFTASEKILKSFEHDDVIEICGDVAIVYHDNPITGARKIEINLMSLVEEIDMDEESDNINIVWDGISKVKAWNGAGKQRVYFNAVGIPASAHAKGRVFLELIKGEWVPNMKYKLMQDLANQLNNAGIKEAEEVQRLYQEFIQNN